MEGTAGSCWLSAYTLQLIYVHTRVLKELLAQIVALLQMEVGIEDCLHIEFEYDKARYHLKDSVIGKIYFLLVSRRGLVRKRATCINFQA